MKFCANGVSFHTAPFCELSTTRLMKRMPHSHQRLWDNHLLRCAPGNLAETRLRFCGWFRVFPHEKTIGYGGKMDTRSKYCS